MVVTEFSRIAYVTTITASCSDFADPKLRDSCLTVGHESHHWALAILGLFVILMAFGAAVGRSRPAAVALVAAGAVTIVIAIAHDLPQTHKKGAIGIAFAEGKAHAGTGLWLELIGGTLALLAGAITFARLRRAGPGGEDPGEAPAA
jgi:peptidoglycan/LPS O-acetylase OafA/YrhL